MSNEKLVAVVLPTLSQTDNPFTHGPNIFCPYCGNDNVHFREAENCESHDSGGCWLGRGDCITIPMWAECDHKWNMIIGFHKGSSYMYYERESKA